MLFATLKKAPGNICLSQLRRKLLKKIRILRATQNPSFEKPFGSILEKAVFKR